MKIEVGQIDGLGAFDEDQRLRMGFYFFFLISWTPLLRELLREWERVMEVVCEEREDGAADWEGDARVLVF